MATYLTGSNSQTDGLQTLYLMNPAYAGYADTSAHSSMVLISPTSTHEGQESPFASSGHQLQQQLIGFSHPPLLTHSSLANHIQGVIASDTNMGHESINAFSGQVSSHGYNWNGGNEFSFLPSSGALEDGQFLGAGFNQVQQPTSDISQCDLGNLVHSSFQDSTPLMHSNGRTLGLNTGSLQFSVGTGQALSLSLSPQQSIVIQPVQLQVNDSAMSSLANAGIEDHVRRSDSQAFHASTVGGYLNRPTLLGNFGESSMNEGQVGRFNSKYLKAAQELLIEVVSIGKGLQDSHCSHVKSQACIVSSSLSDNSSFIKEPCSEDVCLKDGETISCLNGEKFAGVVASLPSWVTNAIEKNAQQADLTPAERQDLQMKKVKLMAMLDEVDRRYKQYYRQLQYVVAFFETAAGIGAAKTYTAFALKTISKHFRCLWDAISGQIKATSRTLGEDEVSVLARGETPGLRLVDQHLQRQQALRQLGMMQQHAWRPQRGLPECSVSILRAWLFEHFLHPYPKDSDKILLARQTGLTRNQVSNWFINARVRLWKPMVEEMYQEETKEVGEDGADQQREPRTSNVGYEDSQLMKHPKLMNSGILEQNQALTGGLLEPNDESSKSMLSAANSFFFDGKESARDTDWKPTVEGLERDIKMRDDDRFREHYGMSHNAVIQVNQENFIGGCALMPMKGRNRYPQETLPASYGGNNGVSLTLGLQQSEKLPLSQMQYSKQSIQSGQVDGALEYYGANEGDYDIMNMQSRKQFAAHLFN